MAVSCVRISSTGNLVKAFVCASLFATCITAHAQYADAQKPEGSEEPQTLSRRFESTSTTPRQISDRVEALHIQGFYAHEALADISRKGNVAIGFEGLVLKNDKPVSFDFPGGTVSDLLNAFVALAPAYRWQEDKGMLHVFRTGAQVSLADVVVDYPGAKDESRLDIWRGLHVMPEYRAWMGANHCQTADRFVPKMFKTHRDPISIEPGTMTFAQLLDQVATKSGQNSWSILQVPGSQKQQCHVWVNVW